MSRNKGTFKRLPDSAFEPLRITAWLECPVVCDRYLPIDGVLYSIAMREKYGCQEFTQSGSDHEPRVTGVQLPLKRVDGHLPSWYYASSFAQWDGEVAEGIDHWNKRVDESLCYLVDFRGRRGKIDTKSGPYKGYHMPIFYRHSLAVRWYVVGEPQEVRKLLRFAGYLGKKTSQGWGAVSKWEVEPHSEDWSVHGPDGKLMRAVPAASGTLYGFRPSYWLRKNQALCLLP
jgi:hypothetical protein